VITGTIDFDCDDRDVSHYGHCFSGILAVNNTGSLPLGFLGYQEVRHIINNSVS
jgi:hypothetical protein